MKIYYHNDLDGACAAAIVKYYYEIFNHVILKEEDFIKLNYKGSIPIDMIEENETVFFVDYSFSKSDYTVLKELLDKTTDIIWIDHHKTSIEFEKEHPELNLFGLRNINRCGAYLSYVFLFLGDNLSDNHSFIDDENNVPLYIKLVDDYDRWQFKYKSTMDFKNGMYIENYHPMATIWDSLYEDTLPDTLFVENMLDKIIQKGSVITRYIESNNNYIRNELCYESEFEGVKCAVINCLGDSKVFGEVYYKYPMVIMWTFDGNKYKYSLRSHEDSNIDCSQFAKKYGGGGHKGAAGFISDKMLLKKIGQKER